LENFSIILVGPVLTCEVVSGLSCVDSGFGPFQQFVGDVVLRFDAIAFVFVVAQSVSVLDFAGLPLWYTSLIFTLDGSDAENVLVSIGALQVASPFLLDWPLVGSTFGGYTFDFFEF